MERNWEDDQEICDMPMAMETTEFATKYADLIAQIKDQIDATLRPACALLPANEPSGLLDSRFGGPIAWPADEPIPTEVTGAPMAMAVQINFANHAVPEGFPTTGLLQVFLANDIQERGITMMREYRRDGDFPLDNGDGFAVIYHADPSSLVRQDYVLPDVDYPIWQDDLPTRSRWMALAAPVMQARPLFHWQNEGILRQIESLPEMDEHYSAVWDFLNDEIWNSHGATAPHLGGYHAPFQSDQRAFFTEYQKYDRCLIALAAMPGIDFGDMSLSLLIESDRLAAADFSDVVAVADTD